MIAETPLGQKALEVRNPLLINSLTGSAANVTVDSLSIVMSDRLFRVVVRGRRLFE